MKISRLVKKSRAGLVSRLRLEILESRDVPSSVQGTVFNDLNGNGTRDAGEPGLAGWTLNVDANRNDLADPGETISVSDANGHYFFDTTNETPAQVGPGAMIFDSFSLDLQVGAGGRWMNTTSTFTYVHRELEPDAVHDFGVMFQPYGPVTPVGGETLVNANTAGGQRGPSVSSDANGNYVVAWYTEAAATGSVRVFNADGSARSGEITVSNGATRVAMAGNGMFMVTWSDSGIVRGQVYRSDGTAVGVPILTAGVAWGVAASANGNFAVLYGTTTRTSSAPTWKVQRYSPAGAPNGSAISVVATNLNSGNASLAMDAAGDFVVVWDNAVPGKSGTTTSVSAQRYSAGGQKVGSLITVASRLNGLSVIQSSVAMNASGRFVVAWWDGAVAQRLAKVYNADGTTAGGVVVISAVRNAEYLPLPTANLAMDNAGTVVFSWTDNRMPIPRESTSRPSGEIRMRRLTASGVLEPELIVNTTTHGAQAHSSVTVAGNGSVIVAWDGYGAGDDQGVFAQRFAQPPAPLKASSAGPGAPAALTAAQAQPVLAAALRRWKLAGADLAALGRIDVRVADLSGDTVGLASGHTITLDANADGSGWFLDRTPRSDSEFSDGHDHGQSGHIDPLTVLEHEVGHLLDHQHGTGVMAETLVAGLRELPEALSPRWAVDLRP